MKVLLMLALMLFAQFTKAQSNQVTEWVIDTAPTSFTIRFVNFLENSFFIDIWAESRKKIKRIRIEGGTTVEINLLSNKWYYIAIATETPNDRFFNRLDILNYILPKQEKYLKERSQKTSTKILIAGLKRLKLSVKVQKNHHK